MICWFESGRIGILEAVEEWGGGGGGGGAGGDGGAGGEGEGPRPGDRGGPPPRRGEAPRQRPLRLQTQRRHHRRGPRNYLLQVPVFLFLTPAPSFPHRPDLLLTTSLTTQLGS